MNTSVWSETLHSIVNSSLYSVLFWQVLNFYNFNFVLQEQELHRLLYNFAKICGGQISQRRILVVHVAPRASTICYSLHHKDGFTVSRSWCLRHSHESAVCKRTKVAIDFTSIIYSCELLAVFFYVTSRIYLSSPGS